MGGIKRIISGHQHGVTFHQSDSLEYSSSVRVKTATTPVVADVGVEMKTYPAT